jgi:ribonuclease HII
MPREQQPKPVPTFECEQAFADAGYCAIAGIDEVGRGALAGPVVAAAVVLDPTACEALNGVIRDSKLMSAAQRREAFQLVCGSARAVAIGWISAGVIDELGIGPANRLALEQAVDRLPLEPDALVCDAFVIEHAAPQVALIDGDARSLTVAAASIVAKVTRDRMMMELDGRFGGYGFHRHVGYGTREHLDALDRLGPCPEHRRSFAPVRRAMDGQALR